MKSTAVVFAPLGNLLTNDILMSIFDKLNIVHKKRLSRVCKRWKYLIDITFLWVTEFNAVDERRCVGDWQPSNWLGLKFVAQRDYIRIPKVSPADILCKTARQLPNLTTINLECCDMNNRTIRTILNSCKKVERLNLDSSTRLNHYSFTLMVQDWAKLKHVNLSCCTEVTEVTALFLIQKLTQLESLNLCGTRITGGCLDRLSLNIRRLDVSYCWGVRDVGLDALARAKCIRLEELSVNNFDFDGSEGRMIALCHKFINLKHLQMSIGPCVADEFFIDRVKTRGFSAIAKLRNLETLIIEKICTLDNSAMLNIFKGCSRLKCLRLNLSWLNYCTDLSFAVLDKHLPNLEELQILYPSAFTTPSLVSVSRLSKLKTLSLVNSGIGNEVFKYIENLENLTNIKFDECRKITCKGLTHLCRMASSQPHRRINASLKGTGILMSRVKSKRNFPPNLHAVVSNFRSNRNILHLPLPL